MKNFQATRQKFNKDAKQIIYTLRNDPIVLGKVRTCVLAFIVGLTVCYAMNSLFNDPLAKKISKKQNEYQAVEYGVPLAVLDTMTIAQIDLQKRQEKLDNQIAKLQQQELGIKQTLRTTTNEGKFSKTILDLLPKTESSSLNGMTQLNQLEPIDREGYTVFPMQVEGVASYPSIYSYIKYLEEQRVIGFIGGIKLEAGTGVQSGADKELAYSIRIGRIEMKGSSL